MDKVNTSPDPQRDLEWPLSTPSAETEEQINAGSDMESVLRAFGVLGLVCCIFGTLVLLGERMYGLAAALVVGGLIQTSVLFALAAGLHHMRTIGWLLWRISKKR